MGPEAVQVVLEERTIADYVRPRLFERERQESECFGKFAYSVNEIKSSVTAFSYDRAKGALTSLQTVLQQGLLPGAPTLAQWTQGASNVPGWNLHADTMSSAASDFRYFGWGYPTSPPGACY